MRASGGGLTVEVMTITAVDLSALGGAITSASTPDDVETDLQTAIDAAAAFGAAQIRIEAQNDFLRKQADALKVGVGALVDADMEEASARLQALSRTHDLLTRRGAVKIVSESRIPKTGLELTGQVTVAEDQREYRPQMLLADEGQVAKADCTCTFFRKQGLKAGPCVHLVALRLAYAEQEAKRLKGLAPQQAITVETRSYSRRDPAGVE